MAAAVGKLMNLQKARLSFSRIKGIYCGLVRDVVACPRFCSSQSSPPKSDDNLSGLMEFFDDSKNWGATNVKVGRAWRIEELRIKSNSDLHKLWYVLLKEKNMLLTMEYYYNKECEVFANPERLDKVEESMENLEEVVRERNRAYYELETTETGEAPTVDLETPHGKLLNREIKEYPIPKHQNVEWQKDQIIIPRNEIAWFHARWREQENAEKRKATRRNANHVKGLLEHFPNIDEQYLRELYPDVEIDKIKRKLS